MFEGMIDPIIERCRPHALTLRDQATMFATGVIERLDRIADAVTTDDIYTVRRPVVGTATPVTIEVPANDEWILESVIARTTPAAAATLDIRDQGGGALRFAVDIPATGGYTSNFSPLRFMGGSILVATLSQPGEFRLVFAIDRLRSARPNLAAGVRNPTPDRTDAPQEVEDTQRHVGSWHPGVPVFGPSARNGH